jgi:hypothetical protein
MEALIIELFATGALLVGHLTVVIWNRFARSV